MKENEKIEKFFRKDRWYVKILSNGKSNGMPYANYIWMKGNPAFFDIPKGYVIHHLDGDALNDDISNLVIMQKHHHSAYHWKYKIIQSEVSIDPSVIRHEKQYFFPIREPKIYPHRKGFRICVREKIDGEIRARWVSTWDGQPLKTKEIAELVKSQIWHPNK